MERQAEEPAFVVGIAWVERAGADRGYLHETLNVEGRARQQAAVLNDPQQAVLFDDEQAARVARRADAVIRGRHSGRDRLQLNRRCRLGDRGDVGQRLDKRCALAKDNDGDPHIPVLDALQFITLLILSRG